MKFIALIILGFGFGGLLGMAFSGDQPLGELEMAKWQGFEKDQQIIQLKYQVLVNQMQLLQGQLAGVQAEQEKFKLEMLKMRGLDSKEWTFSSEGKLQKLKE